uniref:Lipase n=1 Tax=Diabrotica virgifera virgifera TaxID=50390 RepID=A0A6P7GTJ9_DIAVI
MMFKCSTILTTLLLIFLMTISVESDSSEDTNRCKGFEEYRGQIDCKYNPDDYLDVPQIIARHGYPVEIHIVTTSDGYLLTLHRIIGSKNGIKGKQPVLLSHGVLGSSADWILDGDTALGYLLADNGYDVWMKNDRGNIYSKGHVSLPNWSAQYWNFSFHEMGIYDLPAIVSYISNITGKGGDLLYIGHSMGTTQFFVFSSLFPKLAAKHIKLMVGLAPTAYMTHIRSPIRYLAPFSNDLNWLAKHLGITEIKRESKFFEMLTFICETFQSKKICSNVLFLLCPSERNETNTAILPTIFAHDPAGSSVKNFIHYAQEIKDHGNFQYFDYGAKQNMIIYGNATPPSYPIKNIQVPIYLVYAPNDMMTSPIDVLRLSKKLRNLAGLYKVPDNDFTHLDYIFGKYVYQLVYKPILKVLRNYTDV